MRSTFAVILGVLAVGLLASTPVCADPTWTDCILTVHGMTETVKLTPSYEASGSGWIYTYVLTNTSDPYRVEITAFTLTLPTAAPVSSCTELEHPAGWQVTIRTMFNQLDWNNVSGNDIAYGQTGTFKFSTAFGPSSDKPGMASSQDALGFSGKSYAPVPEPASFVALLAGIGGLVGLRRRRTA